MPSTRTENLISTRYHRLIIPNISASLVKSLILFVDTFIAGQYIGMTALASIAIASPILALDEMLHCLLGMGVSMHVVQAVGQGKRQRANRIIGATLIAVLITYSVIFLPILLYLRPILSLLTTDKLLMDLASEYMLPMLLSLAPFEMMLCLERAYMVDGRDKLFAVRPVVTSISNILFDLLLVSVLHWGMLGLGLATVFSTFLGYCVTLSHGFSKNCSIQPDFTIVCARKEFFSYLKENARRAGPSALDEGLSGFIRGFVCKFLATTGGTTALAIWGVFTRLQGILNACQLGINRGATLLGGTLYAEEDYQGTRTVFKNSFRSSLVLGIIFTCLAFGTISYLAPLLGVQLEAMAECKHLLRLISPIFPLIALNSFILNAAIVMERYALAYQGKISDKVFILLCVFLGSYYDTAGLFASYALAKLLGLIYLWCYLKYEDKPLLPIDTGNELQDYSLILEPEAITRISDKAQNYLEHNNYSKRTAMLCALFIEDSSNLIRTYNKGYTVSADIRLCLKQNKLVLTIIDDGKRYNVAYNSKGYYDLEQLEKIILIHLSDAILYDRVLELNHLVVKIPYEKLLAHAEHLP